MQSSTKCNSTKEEGAQKCSTFWNMTCEKAFTFTAGKRHTFTITLAKTGSGIDVSIGAWDVDDTDNGGTATGE